MEGYCPRSITTKLCRVGLVMMLLATVVKCPLAYAVNEDKPNLFFVDTATVVLSPDNSGAFKTDLAIKNLGKKGKATAKFAIGDKQDCTGAQLTPETIEIESNSIEVKRFEVSNVKLPATCFIELVVDGVEGNTSLKQIKLTQQYVPLPVFAILSACFVISLAVACAARLSAGKLPRDFKLGSPAWEFAKSWASTTTLVGAVISTALTLSALPELTQYASKSGYALLALLVSFVVIVAPFVFIAFRTGEPKQDDGNKTYSVEYEGPLGAFLLSSALTVFAGLAQLVVLLMLVHEVFRGLWSLVANIVLGLLLGAALCLYAFRSMLLTIKLQQKQKDEPPTDDQKKHFLERKVTVPAVVKGQRVTWSVL
jgi:hypothetical protein